MKDKTFFGMLNDDYRELVLKEKKKKKVRANIREKSKLRKLDESEVSDTIDKMNGGKQRVIGVGKKGPRFTAKKVDETINKLDNGKSKVIGVGKKGPKFENKNESDELDESVNVNVSPDGNINVNVEENQEPVTEIEAPEVEAEPTEDIIEEGCSDEDKKEKESEEIKESETEEEIGEDVINSIVSKLAGEDEELAAKVKEILSKDSDEEESTEEIPEEPFEECEISSYKVTRIAPKSNAYMLEAQTKDGLKYIIGKNFNETEKTLDEAEILDNKLDASNKFRSLLK